MKSGTNRQSAKVFTDLIMWQKSHQFVLKVYEYTECFPSREIYGLISQFRRAAVSIPVNIAEGFKRHGKQGKRRYLNISQSSVEECRYYLILANDLRYGDSKELMEALAEISKLLESYTNSISDSRNAQFPVASDS